MTSPAGDPPPLSRAEYLRTGFRQHIGLQGRLLAPADPAIAVAVAVLGAFAIGVTRSWVVLLLVVVAVVVHRVLARRRARRAATAMLAIAAMRPDLDRWEQGDLASVPVFMLEPEDAVTAAQLERILRPTPEDRRALAAAAPAVVGAPTLSMLAVALGIIVLLGGVVALLVGVRGAGILVPLVVGLPLLGLGLDVFRAVDVMRRVALVVIDRAREQLPRLWAAEPNASSGQVVRSVGDAYALDVGEIPGASARASRAPGVVLIVVAVLATALVTFAEHLS